MIHCPYCWSKVWPASQTKGQLWSDNWSMTYGCWGVVYIRFLFTIQLPWQLKSVPCPYHILIAKGRHFYRKIDEMQRRIHVIRTIWFIVINCSKMVAFFPLEVRNQVSNSCFKGLEDVTHYLNSRPLPRWNILYKPWRPKVYFLIWNHHKCFR